MGQENILNALNELEGSEARIYFQNYLRQSIRETIVELMNEEVTLLCGPKHMQDNPSEYKRAGSEQGVYFEGSKKQSITRPRVRKDNQEVSLKSYEMARDSENISEEVYRCLCSGVSTREFNKLNDGETVSKSELSRMWAARATAKFEEFRSRDLSHHKFFGLMLDGVYLSNDVTGIVALGIDINGDKVVLDFVVGASENFEVCKDLMVRLSVRNLSFTERIFCVLDGSDALKKAVLSFHKNVVFQRCLVHKERNLHSFLSFKDRAECSRLLTRLRKTEGEDDAREVYSELESFLASKNAAAHKSLLEAGEELISLQLLGSPSTLNVSLLSTNIIENSIKNIRRKINRVTRWKADTPQAERWLATGLIYAEEGFRKIKGYTEIPDLIRCLNDFSLGPNQVSNNEPALVVENQ